MLKQLKYTSILALSALAVACSGGEKHRMGTNLT